MKHTTHMRNDAEKRSSGIPAIGDVPWGTHLCQFYRTKRDLLDTLVPYFSAGLKNNEFCMWVTSDPLSAEEATRAMRKAVPHFARYVRSGQIEIIPHDQWYTKGGRFDERRVLNGWVTRYRRALAKGFDGLRLTGNTFWLEKDDWGAFAAYEATVNRVIGKYKMLALCTYSLEKCGAREVFDVMRNHEATLVRSGRGWQTIESTKAKRLREEVVWLASFPQRNPLPVIEADRRHLVYVNPVGKALLPDIQKQGMAHPIFKGLWGKSHTAARTYLTEIYTHGTHFLRHAKYFPQSQRIRLYLVDITKLKQSEQALRRSEEKYEMLVERSNDGIVVVQDGVVKFANQKILNMIGRPAAQVIGKSFFSHVAPKYRDTVAARYAARLRGAPVPERYELELVTASTPAFPVEVNGALIQYEGRLADLIFVRDITRWKEIDRVKSEFVTLASHQLRTPLTGIKWYAELLEKEGRGTFTPKQAEYLGQVIRSGVRMARLIDDLLTVAHIESGRKFDVTIAPADLIAMIREVVGELGEIASRRSITITMEGVAGRAVANVDEEKFRIALHNIIDNAVKYSPDRRRVVVSYRRGKKDAHVITVRDVGIGIPQRQQSRVFEKFFRADNALTLQAEGTGLGLYIAKSIIDAHDGNIAFTSEEGKGTEFAVTLSAANEKTPAVRQARRRADGEPTTGSSSPQR